jgi:hypothetical protein
MNINIKVIKENKDGSANAEVKFDKEGLEILVQWGLVAMLTKAIDEYAVRPDEDSAPIINGTRSVTKKATTVAKKTTRKKKC